MNRLIAVLLSAAVVTSIAGCRSPDDPRPSPGEDLYSRAQHPNVNDPYGGYNSRDERPAFGDPVLLAQFGARSQQSYRDPFATDPEVLSIIEKQSDELFLLITWGNLYRKSTIHDPVDWSGSLTITPGVVLLKRTVLLDEADRIITRTDRGLLEWQSTTDGDIDGILVRVLVADNGAGVDSAGTYLRFRTPSTVVDFSLRELAGINQSVTTADGNAVTFTAVDMPVQNCPQGFMRGPWINDNPDILGGEFFGSWATPDSQITGFVKGIYGVNRDSIKVFFGKMIRDDGRFEGIARGFWGYTTETSGEYHGTWLNRALRRSGGMQGMWDRNVDHPSGFFRGEWKRFCFSK